MASLIAYIDVWPHIHSRSLIQAFLRLMVSLIYYSAKSLVDAISNILHSNLFTHPLEQMLQLKHLDAFPSNKAIHHTPHIPDNNYHDTNSNQAINLISICID